VSAAKALDEYRANAAIRRRHLARQKESIRLMLQIDSSSSQKSRRKIPCSSRDLLNDYTVTLGNSPAFQRFNSERRSRARDCAWRAIQFSSLSRFLYKPFECSVLFVVYIYPTMQILSRRLRFEPESANIRNLFFHP
jgi:hypothetical protein